MSKLIIGLNGLNATGKTKLSEILEKTQSARIIHIRGELKKIADSKGIDPKRYYQLVEKRSGPAGIIDEIEPALVHAYNTADFIVIEGLFSAGQWARLKLMFPDTKSFLVTVATPLSKRLERLEKRAGSKQRAEKQRVESDKLRVRKGILGLTKVSDFTVNNVSDCEKTFQQIFETELRKRLFQDFHRALLGRVRYLKRR